MMVFSFTYFNFNPNQHISLNNFLQLNAHSNITTVFSITLSLCPVNLPGLNKLHYCRCSSSAELGWDKKLKEDGKKDEDKTQIFGRDCQNIDSTYRNTSIRRFQYILTPFRYAQKSVETELEIQNLFLCFQYKPLGLFKNCSIFFV